MLCVFSVNRCHITGIQTVTHDHRFVRMIGPFYNLRNLSAVYYARYRTSRKKTILTRLILAIYKHVVF